MESFMGWYFTTTAIATVVIMAAREKPDFVEVMFGWAFGFVIIPAIIVHYTANFCRRLIG